MIFSRLFLFFLILFFPGVSFPEAGDPRIDLMVFAPHPDDESLACGQTIIRAIKEHKKIKVVFLTNGDGSKSGACAFLNKPGSELLARDYIALGQERQEEALRAAVKMGLSGQDLIFFGYPDSGLAFLWGRQDLDRYKSEHTDQSASTYKKTWGRAKSGYTRQNLTRDIKDILKKYQPRIIYSPSPLDQHKDHSSGANFLNKALDELRNEQKDKFISPRVFYYTIHSAGDSVVPDPDPGSRLAKAEVLKEYRTQAALKELKKIFDNAVLKNEIFFPVPDSQEAYLAGIRDDWSRKAARMRSRGYTLNLGVVADVADDINNPGADLARKGRIFSDDPGSVFQLVDQIVQAHNSQGLTPVVKHFPGLGAMFNDTHQWLPRGNSSLGRLNEKDLAPYKKLIGKNRIFMIMTSHAIYPALDDKPASLSYKIQSRLLRDQMGFKGLIISDELLNMQAMEEYALQQGISGPFIGEIAVMAFAAGTDMVIIYPDPQKTEEIILAVIESAKKAVREGKLSGQDIDDSVARILREKERVFGQPLAHLLKTMPIEEKICQKIIVDTYSDAEAAVKYNLGGIHARDHKVIPKVQAQAKTPFFIAGMHEGGRVVEAGLDLYTPSAYVIGREFERTLDPRDLRSPAENKAKVGQKTLAPAERSFFDFSQLSWEEQEKIINILAGSVDGHIKFYADFKQNRIFGPAYADYLSPLNTVSQNQAFSVTLKDFRDLPLKWLRNFPDRNTAICAYELFKEIFRKWDLEEHKLEKIDDPPGPKSAVDQMVLKLNRLKAMLRQIKPMPSSRELRVMCLAAHPDDEDAESLVYFKKRFNAKTYILLATRGEAGENQIGPELYDDLGFLRIEEMERAATVLGVDRVYYMNEKDFGYCLDPQEAFKNWGKEEALSRLVYFFRLIRPDVVVTAQGPALGHCAERALNILGQEAFELSGDPKALPAMIEDGLPAWQAKRFYQRSFDQRSFNRNEELPLDEISIDPEELAPSTDKTYRRLAEESLAEHKSQGDMSFRVSLPGKIVYELVKEADNVKYKTGGIDPGNDLKSVCSGFPGLKVANKLRIGLLEENDNILFVSLKTLGCDFQKLDGTKIKDNDLSGLDTILIGKGAAKLFTEENTRKQLGDFAARGGNLVVLFQPRMPAEVNMADRQFQVTFDALVGPASPVTILLPDHPLFNWPNKIRAKDFSGWRQERGLFFPEQYDRSFRELTSCQGSRSKTIKSGYLISDCGRGSLIFSTYSWARQLREFHPGAFKNLANMISYPLKGTQQENHEFRQ